MFKIKTDKESVQASGTGSKFISTSGIYPVTINFASISESKNGNKGVNFNVTYNEDTQTFYGPYYESKTGDTFAIGSRVYNTLGVIAGMTDGDSPTISQETHKVGKDNKAMDFDVIDEFAGLDVYIQIKESYRSFKNNIIRDLKVIGFWNAAGSSAEEIVNDDNHGVNMALVEEKYASIVGYENVTEKEVANWKEAKSKDSGTAKSTTPKSTRSTVKFGTS